MKYLFSLITIVILTNPVWGNTDSPQTAPIPVKVQVQLHDQIRRYAYTPKLSEVLAPVALKRDWYWPASALYKLQDNTAQQQRQNLLAQINALKTDADSELTQELNRTASFINSWSVATRVDVSIDYDLVRARPQKNLGFDDGHYLLKLYTRPQSVEFWGAVDKVMSVPHSGGKTITDYLPGLQRSAVADTSYVLIIRPDGEMVRAGVESWNEQHTELMPGASVFIPFSAGLLHDLTPLNSEIADLARHRVK